MLKDDVLIVEQYIRSRIGSYIKESDLNKVLRWLGELDVDDRNSQPDLPKNPNDTQSVGPVFDLSILDLKGSKPYNEWDPNNEEHPLLGHPGDGPGVYPEMQGLDKVKTMIVDGYDSELDMLFAAAAVDTLRPEQLMLLALANHNGTPLEELPAFVAEFDDGSEPGYFNVPESTLKPACDVFDRAYDYFKKEPQAIKIPQWLQQRYDNTEWPELLKNLTKKRRKTK